MQDKHQAGAGRSRATLLGTAAVLMWSMLAPLTAATRGIPPLQLLAETFGVAFLCGTAWLLITGGLSSLRWLRPPLPYVAFTAAALFGYHALYFVALSLIPPAPASLIAYLWPLLIVWFAALVSKGRLVRARHFLGALLGLVGTAVLVLLGEGHGFILHQNPFGVVAALACAVIWSGYSVLNCRFRDVPSDAMVAVCGVVAVLGWIAHLTIDSQSARPSGIQWLAIAALGVGPVGLAFVAWDHGTKHGDVGLLGSISYAAPVLSTFLLVVLGYAPASLPLLVAAVLVVAAAWIASRPSDPTPNAS